MNRRPPFALVLILLLLGLGAFAQRQAHVMGVQHEWCASHAQWTHASCDDVPAASSHCGNQHGLEEGLAAEEELSSDEHSHGEGPVEEEHEHCSWILLDELRAESPQLSAAVLGEARLTEIGRQVMPPASSPCCGPTPLSLAPKNSPPL